MSPLSVIYKVQQLDKSSGFWLDVESLPGEQYNEAVNALYKHFKLNDSLNYRLVQLKEELVDILYPRPK